MTGGVICLGSYLLILVTDLGYASDFIFVPVAGALFIAGGGTYVWMSGQRHNHAVVKLLPSDVLSNRTSSVPCTPDSRNGIIQSNVNKHPQNKNRKRKQSNQNIQEPSISEDTSDTPKHKSIPH
jgi:hypothetical protein